MRGRIGLCMLLAATLVVGCAHKTPEQKAAEKAQKQAVAQAKAERKAADKQAKAQAKAEKKRLAEEQDRAEAQAKAAKKQADAQAKADKKRMAEEREHAEAQAKAQSKAAEQQAKIDRERAAAQAKAEQQRQAEEQQLAQQKAAAAERAAKEQADHDAFAQKQQAKMAMADSRAATKAAKASKKSKAKKEKPVTYPDDEQWVVGDPYISPENHTRQTDRHFESMSAKGAVGDATLYDQHFDGAELNSLGRSKVALMLEAAPKNEPLTIYVPTIGSDERIQARLTAVQNFWKSSQYAAVEMQTKQGVNPNTATPAGTGLAALRRLEKEAAGGSGTGSSGVSASGGPGAGGGASGSSGR